MLLNQLRIYDNREEYAQIAFIGLWKATESYVQGKYDFHAYCYNHMRFAVIDALRKEIKQSARFVAVEDQALTFIVDQQERPIATSDLFEALLKRVSKEEGQLLRMIFIEQYTNEEIAATYQLSIEAARKRKYRLMQKLKKLFREGL